MTTTPEIRHCTSPADFDACVRMQQVTWGDAYRDGVPASLLKVSRRVGGIVAGAFEPAHRMIGFVFGLTGPDATGRLVHWSHMLAVRRDYRDRGIGTALKSFQRDTLRGTGVETIAWTFDPLVARNAHLNLNRLGARVIEYVPDMYADTGSGLHAFGTDRVVVEWPVDAAASPGSTAGAGGTGRTAVIVNARPGAGAAMWPEHATMVGIEVPADIEAIAQTDPAAARAWRECTRPAFLEAGRRGLAVTGFVRTVERCFYVLGTMR